jgi:hypothetical protein
MAKERLGKLDTAVAVAAGITEHQRQQSQYHL